MRRAVAAVAWIAASVALHGWVLGAVAPFDTAPPAPVSTLHVRTLPVTALQRLTGDIPSAAPATVPVAALAPVRLAPLPATHRRAVAVFAAAAAKPPDVAATVEEATATATATPAATATATAEPTAMDAAVGAGSDRSTGGDGVYSAPVYRTAPPPAMRLSYELRHGFLSGQGVIDWRPSAGQYELRLEGRVASLTLLTQVSTGGFDANGLAPVRYTDQRMKRATNAANLQRSSGRITFSGPSTEYALLPGTQDRVSWMVQLAAIVNADPTLAKPGAEIKLFVVGAKGEGDIWVFRCIGEESVDTGLGPMPALKFMRDPTKPHDTQVEAWLAPKLHGLPAHARLSNGNDGALDLILRDAQ